MFNIEYVEVALNSDFSLDYEVIQEAMKLDRVRAIVFVNPGNPTGSVHTDDDFNKLRELLEGTDILLIADETYEYFTFEDKHRSARSSIGLDEQIISIQSFSFRSLWYRNWIIFQGCISLTLV